MKASELIVALQKLIDEHGDLPVATYNSEYGSYDEVTNPPAVVESESYPDTPSKKLIGI